MPQKRKFINVNTVLSHSHISASLNFTWKFTQERNPTAALSVQNRLPSLMPCDLILGFILERDPLCVPYARRASISLATCKDIWKLMLGRILTTALSLTAPCVKRCWLSQMLCANIQKFKKLKNLTSAYSVPNLLPYHSTWRFIWEFIPVRNPTVALSVQDRLPSRMPCDLIQGFILESDPLSVPYARRASISLATCKDIWKLMSGRSLTTALSLTAPCVKRC